MLQVVGGVSGLKCGVCGAGWKLDKPLLYHFGQLHCDTFGCSRECSECKDDFEAVDAAAAPASFPKAPGYAAMMARLKGGESK